MGGDNVLAFVEIGIFVVGSIASAFWFFKTKIDEKQQTEINALKEGIKLLHSLHEQDSAKLAALELKIANDYISEPQVYAVIHRIEAGLKEFMTERFNHLDANIKEIMRRRKDDNDD